MNKEQFLRDKLSNFCNWLEERIARLPEERQSEAKGFLSSLREITSSNFISLIVSMAVYRNNISVAVDRLLVEAQIDRTAFSPDDFKKAQRYLEMFIDVVCE